MPLQEAEVSGASLLRAEGRHGCWPVGCIPQLPPAGSPWRESVMHSLSPGLCGGQVDAPFHGLGASLHQMLLWLPCPWSCRVGSLEYQGEVQEMVMGASKHLWPLGLAAQSIRL